MFYICVFKCLRDSFLVMKNCFGKEDFSFWKEFEKFLNVVVNKKRMDKYELLEEMEERRIKKYVAYLI